MTAGLGLTSDDTTDLLRQWSGGCERSAERILDRLYPDLAALAAARLAGWSLPVGTSDVLQELALRLSSQTRTEWRDRRHFFAIAARLVRRVLVDEARRSGRIKRGAAGIQVALDEATAQQRPTSTEVLDVNRALGRLREVDATAAHLVELRYFAGLSVTEAAAVLGVSTATAVRRWRYARAWLLNELGERPREP